jgi:hypothetical protein
MRTASGTPRATRGRGDVRFGARGRRAVATALASVSLFVMALAATAPPSFAAPTPQPSETSLLFVQSATSGSLVPVHGAPERFTLTLRGVDGQTLWFTDRPERRAGYMTTGAGLKVLDFRGSKGAPNAVLSIPSAKPSKDMIALTLRDPKYDPQQRTVQYRATELEHVTNTELAVNPRYLDESVGPRFGHAALFIDSAHPFMGCNLTVNWGTTGPNRGDLQLMKHQDFIPDWGDYDIEGLGHIIPEEQWVAWGRPFVLDVGIAPVPLSSYWCRGGVLFRGPDNGSIFIYFNNPVKGSNEWGCNAPKQYRCTMWGSDSGSDLKVKVNLDKIS